MSTSTRLWLTLLTGVIAIGLPLAGRQMRSGGAPCCDLDGTKIIDIYRVDIVDGEGNPHAFCCPRCARIWLKHQKQPPTAITVTDESTGETLDASSAWYVGSSVVTNHSNGNRVHVFARQADAEKHAETFLGLVLPKSESPFLMPGGERPPHSVAP